MKIKLRCKGIVLSGLMSLVMTAAAGEELRIALPGHGEVWLEVERIGGWSFSLRQTDDGTTPDVFEVTFSVTGMEEGHPPVAHVKHVMEKEW